MNGPETYVTANSQTLFLPQPLLDGLHTTCYHESGIWRIFRLSDATAPVAQWIEQLTSNLQAVGSSPAGRARVHGPLPNVHLFSVYSPFQLIVGGFYADLYNSQLTGETSRRKRYDHSLSKSRALHAHIRARLDSYLVLPLQIKANASQLGTGPP